MHGIQVNISIMKKNKKFQKEQLTAEGYTEIVEFFRQNVITIRYNMNANIERKEEKYMAEVNAGTAQNTPMCRSDKGNDRQRSHSYGMGSEEPVIKAELSS